MPVEMDECEIGLGISAGKGTRIANSYLRSVCESLKPSPAKKLSKEFWYQMDFGHYVMRIE